VCLRGSAWSTFGAHREVERRRWRPYSVGAQPLPGSEAGARHAIWECNLSWWFGVDGPSLPVEYEEGVFYGNGPRRQGPCRDRVDQFKLDQRPGKRALPSIQFARSGCRGGDPADDAQGLLYGVSGVPAMVTLGSVQARAQETARSCPW
jgi:hypothetical protein